MAETQHELRAVFLSLVLTITLVSCQSVSNETKRHNPTPEWNIPEKVWSRPSEKAPWATTGEIRGNHVGSEADRVATVNDSIPATTASTIDETLTSHYPRGSRIMGKLQTSHEPSDSRPLHSSTRIAVQQKDDLSNETDSSAPWYRDQNEALNVTDWNNGDIKDTEVSSKVFDITEILMKMITTPSHDAESSEQVDVSSDTPEKPILNDSPEKPIPNDSRVVSASTFVYEVSTTETPGGKVNFYTAADFDKTISDEQDYPPQRSQHANISFVHPSSDFTQNLRQFTASSDEIDKSAPSFQYLALNSSELENSATDTASPVYTNSYHHRWNTSTMAWNRSSPTQNANEPERPMIITKLQDLNGSELDSDVLFKAIETEDDLINHSVSSKVGDTDSSTGDILRLNKGNALTESAANHTSEASQFDFSDGDCLYDLLGSSGRLTFPDVEHFPISGDKEFVICRWRVRVPDGPNIKISVERLALSLGVEQLEIAVGVDEELKKRTFTGSKVPQDFVTMGTRLWLTARVRNDDFENKIVLRFQQSEEEATFPVEKNYLCGGMLTALSGNITSPGQSELGHYSNNEDCSWYIVAPSQSVIRLIVRQFRTEVYDHVTVGIGLQADASNSKLLTLYGHLQEERQTVIPANSLWIHFVSDDSDTDTGFWISYQVLPREICNTSNTSNILTESEGLITSLDYPKLYPINSECTWYIRAPPGAYVNMTFFDLCLEDSRDFVLIGEGSEIFGGPFMTFTGNTTDLNPVRLNSSDVWIHFTSDHVNGDYPYRGFSLSYQIFFYHRTEVAMTTEHPEEEENQVQQDIPMNDHGQGQVITIPLAGIQETQLKRKLKEFRAEVARIWNGLCTRQGGPEECGGKHKPLTGQAVRVLGARPQAGRLLVQIRIEADDTWPVLAMADADYEELEKLFHTDLQSLDLQDEDAADKVSSHLPEWLIGVIVVVILLIVAFFAMVIYSLMKERKKNRAGSYRGTTSTASVCEDVEVGKVDSNIRITAFTLEQNKESEGTNGQGGDGSNGAMWTMDSEVASTLQRRELGVSGCMNPAFIDDEAEKEETSNEGDNSDSSKKENKNSKPSGKATNSDSNHSSKSVISKPDSSPSNQGEELEMQEKQPEVKVEVQKNGSAVSPGNEAKDDETAVDEADDGERSQGKRSENSKAKTEEESAGPRQLEVVVNRQPPPSVSSTSVLVHADKDSQQRSEF